MADDGLTFLFEQGDELLLLLNQRINLRRLVVEELGDSRSVPRGVRTRDAVMFGSERTVSVFKF